MTHLRWTVGPVAILFHLLVITQSIVGRKPGVRHARRWLRRVVVLRRPKLLVTTLQLVTLLWHSAIVRVRLLVVVTTTVSHIWHIGV